MKEIDGDIPECIKTGADLLIFDIWVGKRESALLLQSG